MEHCIFRVQTHFGPALRGCYALSADGATKVMMCPADVPAKIARHKTQPGNLREGAARKRHPFFVRMRKPHRISGIPEIGSEYVASQTAFQHSGLFAHSEIILPPAEL